MSTFYLVIQNRAENWAPEYACDKSLVIQNFKKQETVKVYKEHIVSKMENVSTPIKLMFRREELKDDLIIRDVIPKFECIRLVRIIPVKVRIRVSDGSELEVEANPIWTIRNLKEFVKKEKGYSVDDQTFTCSGMNLRNLNFIGVKSIVGKKMYCLLEKDILSLPTSVSEFVNVGNMTVFVKIGTDSGIIYTMDIECSTETVGNLIDKVKGFDKKWKRLIHYLMFGEEVLDICKLVADCGVLPYSILTLKREYN